MVLKETLSTISSAFWSESVWLPPNTTWQTYKDCADGIQYAQYNDLYYSIITAIVFLVTRYIFESCVFAPLGVLGGIRPHRTFNASANPKLETVISAKGNRVLSADEICGIAKQLDISESSVRRWLRRRARRGRSAVLDKFTECCWRCLFYSFAFFYGAIILWDKSWTWDSMECFYDYPRHSVTPGVWWYYNVELGFCLSLMVSQFFDIKRKDFWQMFIHHIVTACLLIFSWACNLHRIGTLVLVIHDFADIPLEGSKLCRYLKAPRCANVIFSIFSVCWIYSRLGLLPTRVIMYSSYYALFVVPMFPAYYIFNGLLCTLQVLHIIWTWLILRIAYNAIFKDGVKDLRESDSSEEEESETETPVKRAIKNSSNSTFAEDDSSDADVLIINGPSSANNLTKRS